MLTGGTFLRSQSIKIPQTEQASPKGTPGERKQTPTEQRYNTSTADLLVHSNHTHSIIPFQLAPMSIFLDLGFVGSCNFFDNFNTMLMMYNSLLRILKHFKVNHVDLFL